MRTNQFSWVAMLVLAGLTGCAMCDNSQDCAYPAFGGKWVRDNPFSGRVASLFDPAGHQVAAPAAVTIASPLTGPAENVQDAETVEPTLATEGASEPASEKATDQGSAPAGGAETEQPQAAEKMESGDEAKPAAEKAAPDEGLKSPAMPGEQSKTEDRKEGGTNLLPPLELPPQR